MLTKEFSQMLSKWLLPPAVFLLAGCLPAQTPVSSSSDDLTVAAQVEKELARAQKEAHKQIKEQIKAGLAQAKEQTAQAQVELAQIENQFQQALQEGLAQAQTLLAQAQAPAPPQPPQAPQPPDSTFQMYTGSGSYLGVGVEEIASARAKELKLKEERGVEIRRVEPESPAEKAGLKEHDVVLEYNGQRVEGVESFTRMVRETPVGRAARLLISRDGNTQTLNATIGRRRMAQVRPFNFTMPAIPPIDIPRPVMTMRTGRVGIEIESLSGQLAEFFGVKEGVLVRSVEKDSPAEKAGIKTGDVILKASGQSVETTRDLTEALRENRDKKTIPLQVMRSKKEMSLNLELPERSRSENRARAVRLRQDRL